LETDAGICPESPAGASVQNRGGDGAVGVVQGERRWAETWGGETERFQDGWLRLGFIHFIPTSKLFGVGNFSIVGRHKCKHPG
jgi:hypothetical protein